MIEWYFMDPEDETYQSKFVNTGRSVESCKSLHGMIKNIVEDPELYISILSLSFSVETSHGPMVQFE